MGETRILCLDGSTRQGASSQPPPGPDAGQFCGGLGERSCDLGGNVGEQSRMQRGGFAGPGYDDHGWRFVGFDQFDGDAIGPRFRRDSAGDPPSECARSA
jgi:hypothetical protein